MPQRSVLLKVKRLTNHACWQRNLLKSRTSSDLLGKRAQLVRFLFVARTFSKRANLVKNISTNQSHSRMEKLLNCWTRFRAGCPEPKPRRRYSPASIRKMRTKSAAPTVFKKTPRVLRACAGLNLVATLWPKCNVLMTDKQEITGCKGGTHSWWERSVAMNMA